MKVLKMAREERYAVLGLNNQDKDEGDDGLPELAVAELSPEQIEEMRSRDIPSDDDADGEIESLGAPVEVELTDDDSEAD